MGEEVKMEGLPTESANYFAINCFILAATNFCLLLPPILGSLLITNTMFSVRCLCLCVASVQILLLCFRPFPVRHQKTADTAKRKMHLTLQSGIFLLLSAFAFHIIAILYGAPLTNLTTETFHFGLTMTVLTTLPLCINVGPYFTICCRIFLGTGPENVVEVYTFRLIIITIFGALIGAFPIPLDWDRPWQVWPITCCSGAVICNGLGNSALAMWLLLTQQSPKSRRRKRV